MRRMNARFRSPRTKEIHVTRKMSRAPKRHGIPFPYLTLSLACSIFLALGIRILHHHIHSLLSLLRLDRLMHRW